MFGAALAFAAATATLAGALTYYACTPFGTFTEPVHFDLKAGSSLRAAAKHLEQVGVLRHAELFMVIARLLGESGNIKAGNYQLDAPVSPYELLRKITRGEVSLSAITFVEGWHFRQMRRVLDAHPEVRHDTLGMSDFEILQRLSIDAASPEGLFFPDTYYFGNGTSDLKILRRAHARMQQQLAALWEKRAAGLPFATPYEALILASIVEKETGRAEERPLIAAVFVNRLRKGMPLQADPTVIYGLGEAFDGNLRKRDLTTDTPYNTYTRAGLPPTPIAMPSLASLAAVLDPPPSDMLYFVSRGDGTSHFSRTLVEHERAVIKYQKSGRR
jgi:UPF0755 protein